MGRRTLRVVPFLTTLFASSILYVSLVPQAQAHLGLAPDTCTGVLCSNNVLNADSAMHAKLVQPKIKKEEPKPTKPQFIPTAYVAPASIQPQAISGQTQEVGLNADVLFAMVNTHRESIGLPSFEKHPDACSIAQSRAPEIYNEMYVTYTLHSGLYNRDLPYWITENTIYMRTEKEAFNWWLNSTVHSGQIRSDYAYSCMACHGFACVQMFTNFTPKETAFLPAD